MSQEYSEENFLMLSALQHIQFCERQCALIHIEQIWTDNQFTADGKVMHERVDRGDNESRGKIRIDYAMPIRCLRLGLIGKADVVEFHRNNDGGWIPFPVEYKRGKPKVQDWDRI